MKKIVSLVWQIRLITLVTLLSAGTTCARFVAVDPKADQYPSVSPYLYSANNPIKFLDPDGNGIVLPSTTAKVTGRPCVMSPIMEAVIYDVPGPSAITGPTLKSASSGLRGLLKTAFQKVLGKTDDAADMTKGVSKVVDEIAEVASEGKKIPNKELLAPPTKRGNAPTGSDGNSVELHHRGQSGDGPLDEMTFTEHRGKGNYKKNHPNTGQNLSGIDRKKWAQQQRDYWRREWDSGRFKEVE